MHGANEMEKPAASTCVSACDGHRGWVGVGGTHLRGGALAEAPAIRVCGEIVQVITLPAAPRGLVSTQTLSVGNDCQVHSGPVEFVDPATLVSIDGDAQEQITVVGESPSTLGSLSALSTSNAYAVSRSWDCCGILMNEYFMNVQWAPSTAGSNVTSWSAWDGAKWHVEGFGLGWRLDSSNHSLGRSAGGVGSPSVTVHGRQGFSYQGAFDPTGTVFYNTYDSWLEGKPGFTFGQCTLQIVWRHGAPFWHTQAWCGSGTYS